MNERLKYFGLSVVLHGAVLMLIIALTAGDAARREVVIIDFNLDNPPPSSETRQAKQPLSTPAPSSPSKPEPVRQAVAQPAAPLPSVTTPAVAMKPVAQPATAAVQPATGSAGQRVENNVVALPSASGINSARTAAASPASSTSIGETAVEQVRKKYLKEHFNYIRDLIIKRLVYPPIARRMEWSGKVVLAFVVGEDGGVRSIHIRESSGHQMLDDSAVDAVKSVAPFPRPPVAAEIVMPVHFRLQ